MRSTDLIASGQDVRVRVPKHKNGPFAGAEFLRSGDHALQHRIKIQEALRLWVRSASISVSRRRRSTSASACFCTVISRAIVEAPMIAPLRSLSGKMARRGSPDHRADSEGLTISNGFTSSETGKNIGDLIWTIWRGQERDRLANDLVGRIAIHPLGP